MMGWKKYHDQKTVENSPFIFTRNNGSVFKNSVLTWTLLDVTTVNKENGLYMPL